MEGHARIEHENSGCRNHGALQGTHRVDGGAQKLTERKAKRMTIRVTITQPGVTNAYGLPLAVGTTYTVEEDFGRSLIAGLKATDTDGYMAIGGNNPYSVGVASRTMTASGDMASDDDD